MRGRVRTYFHDRRFGFIASESGGDCFFHEKNLRRCGIEHVAIGDLVEFESETDHQGRTRVTTLQLVASKAD